MSANRSHKSIVSLVVSMFICIAIIVGLMLPGWLYSGKKTSTGTSSEESAATAEESSAAVAEEEESTIPESGTAVTEDQLENATTCFDGKVVVSYVTKSVSKKTITIRVDNNTDAEVVTFGMPTNNVDGTDIIVSYPANQAVNAVKVPAGEYRTITYKINEDAVNGTSYIFGGKFKATEGFTDEQLTYSLEFKTE